MKKHIYLLALLTLTSCYTLEKAQTNVHKAHLKHPIVTSGFCAKTYPIKTEVTKEVKYIKGETIIRKDTIEVDCDSVVSDKNANNTVLVKYNTIYKTDTILKTNTIVKTNTAEIDNLTIKLKEANDTIDKKKRTIKILTYFLLSIFIFLFIIRLLKI